jgi:hypothetical protein
MSTIADLNPIGALITGSLSSFCTITATQPIAMVKNCLMTGKGLPPLSRQLYRGYLINALCDQTNQPLAFVVNNIYYQQILHGKTATMEERILGGFLSGMLVSPLLSLCERVMIIQQLHPDPITKKSLAIGQVMKKIYSIEGRKGFTKGVIPTIGREGINATCFFGLQPLLAEKLDALVENKEKASTIAFIASGAIAGALSTPFDLIKTITQSQLDGARGSYFKKVKAILVEEHGANLTVWLAKSCFSRTLFIGSGLGMLGFSSTFIPKLLPEAFHKS